ncbi:hypothetical protein [uncultured Maribacter sp.]|uniref:hypothetical protein n=1 Tax=uncultured Maribacter sp. TaxID=431308 RepID=UPI00261DCF07|nr:hypothetical protein [uncultured Maribacter sp.]
MKNNKLQAIKEHLSDLDFDIKAETFASETIATSNIEFRYSDYFKRRYSPDIYSINEDENLKEKIIVNLTRRSFYNIFPERFFHKTAGSTPFVNEMVDGYKTRKIEEENSRAFFRPLEQEFFLHKVGVEKEEESSFESLGSADLVTFLSNLWNINPNFPKEISAKILKTMPFMNKIAGNLPLIKQVLETIVQEKLIITKKFATIENKNPVNEPLQLGINLATAASGKTFLPKYIFTIDTIKNPEKIHDYLPNGKIVSVIHFFLDHTLPFECDFEIDFTLKKKQQHFTLSDSLYSGRLGISSTI